MPVAPGGRTRPHQALPKRRSSARGRGAASADLGEPAVRAKGSRSRHAPRSARGPSWSGLLRAVGEAPDHFRRRCLRSRCDVRAPRRQAARRSAGRPRNTPLRCLDARGRGSRGRGDGWRRAAHSDHDLNAAGGLCSLASCVFSRPNQGHQPDMAGQPDPDWVTHAESSLDCRLRPQAHRQSPARRHHRPPLAARPEDPDVEPRVA